MQTSQKRLSKWLRQDSLYDQVRLGLEGVFYICVGVWLLWLALTGNSMLGPIDIWVKLFLALLFVLFLIVGMRTVHASYTPDSKTWQRFVSSRSEKFNRYPSSMAADTIMTIFTGSPLFL